MLVAKIQPNSNMVEIYRRQDGQADVLLLSFRHSETPLEYINEKQTWMNGDFGDPAFRQELAQRYVNLTVKGFLSRANDFNGVDKVEQV